MKAPQSVLCAVDFSDASPGALRYATALAQQFGAGLTLLTVDDPFLAHAVAVSIGQGALAAQTRLALDELVHATFPHGFPAGVDLTRAIRVGESAPEILLGAAEAQAGAIVMTTRGTRGLRKAVFGSTTERVLRQTSLPVFVAEASDPGPESLDDLRQGLRTLLVPVDLSDSTPAQLDLAGQLAEQFNASVVVTHVVEPVGSGHRFAHVRAIAERERRDSARRRLTGLLQSHQLGDATVSCGYGDPAEEIARLARAHQAGAIVMALHSSSEPPQRIGTVTYRLLCRTPALVIASPPGVRGLVVGHTSRNGAQGR